MGVGVVFLCERNLDLNYRSRKSKKHLKDNNNYIKIPKPPNDHYYRRNELPASRYRPFHIGAGMALLVIVVKSLCACP
jgi:hypothetical protein